ncbi:MAG: serine/threonine-protein kinase [Planctomycetota bacterium]
MPAAAVPPSPLSDADRDEIARRLADWELADSHDGPEALFADRPDLIEPAAKRMRRMHQVAAALDLSAPQATHDPHQQTGPYAIRRRVAEGANGIVYDATHRVTGRRVALKLLTGLRHLSDHARRRFDREAEIGGQLDHRNAATVFDAGEADGVPFIAMRFVDGPPIDEACRVGFSPPSAGSAETRGGLKPILREIVTLFLGACRGVEHAHGKGLIHRDLKPTNLLVGKDGQAVVVDFGLAKQTADAASSISLDAPVRGTVAYASPEQCRDEPGDVRSDVYSLGVVLFRLLAHPRWRGSRRRDRGPDAAGTPPRVSQTRPVPPEAIHPHDLAGPDWQVRKRIATTDARRLASGDTDLDAVVAKALERDPTHRYTTVAALREDLERWLTGRPVVARPPTPLYLLRKWVRRHRARVAIAAALATLVIGITTYAALRVVAERDRAEAAAQEAEAVSAFLVDLLAAVDPSQNGTADARVVDVLAEAERKIETELSDQPLVEARVRLLVGKMMRSIDKTADGSDHLERAVALLTEHAGPDDLRTLTARETLAGHYLILWDLDAAEREARAVVAGLTRHHGPTHVATLDARLRLRTVFQQRGLFEEAAAVTTGLADDVLGTLPESDESVIRVIAAQGIDELNAGHHEAAEPHTGRALTLARRHLGPNHGRTLAYQLNHAIILTHLGRFDEAIALHRDNIAKRESVYGHDGEGALYGMQRLADTLLQRDGDGDAETAVEILLDVQHRWGGDPPWLPTRLEGELLLLKALHETGRDSEASTLEAMLQDEARRATSAGVAASNWLRQWQATRDLPMTRGRDPG